MPFSDKKLRYLRFFPDRVNAINMPIKIPMSMVIARSAALGMVIVQNKKWVSTAWVF